MSLESILKLFAPGIDYSIYMFKDGHYELATNLGFDAEVWKAELTESELESKEFYAKKEKPEICCRLKLEHRGAPLG